jgi:D-alanyl-D-alanine carboxypeptidase
MANFGLHVRVKRWGAIGIALIAGLALHIGCATPSEARGHHGRRAFHHRHTVVFRAHGHHHVHFRGRFRHADAAGDGGGFLTPRGVAAVVVDGGSGRTIFAMNERQPRHPASVTKVMTLYLLFEQIEKGRLRLDSPLMISQRAAAQAPSKLGLAPGETITVENAIKAVVTKSANDIAVAIAENIGGDEESFAQMMTGKARALGMNDTHFANASGLPNSEQITTAYDLALLGRAIQDRFPRYYRYFSTHVFAYNGALHRNHNHLLGRVEGMDGIKTGYTTASGFNLLTSVRRDGHHIVAVVLGGATAGARDRYMEQLIEAHIDEGADPRVARAGGEEPRFDAVPSLESVEQARLAPMGGSGEPSGVVNEEDEAAPAPRPQAAAPTEGRVRPAFVPGVQKRAESERPGRKAHAHADARDHAAVDGSTSHAAKGRTRRETAETTTPSALKRAEGDRTSLAKTDAGRPSHTGWMIQLGATDDAGKANELLARARTQSHALLATAKAFTEKVQKGHETLYRARFAGLEEQSAESACKVLKRSGFSCFATKN